MANALVSMVVNKLREEVYLVGDAKEEVEKLSSTLESIQALLNDAEIMQFHNESMQVWLKKFKDVVYDVEDAVDELIPSPESESETHDGDDRLIGNQPWPCLFSLFSCCGLEDWIRLAHESWTDGDDIGDKVRTFVSKVASQRDFARQIKQVRAKLDQIAADKSKFSFQLNQSFRGGSELHKAVSQTSSLVDKSKMVGRDGDKDIIISKLVSGSSSEEGGIHVISIVGVGGLGKTTLARLICNDKRVTSHFHKVLWVCVSDDFDVVRLTKAIIQDAERENTPLTELNPLQNKLLETLEGKRFLLVLDDVWNDNSDKWEELWLSFQSGAPGSKILVTTRSENFANTCKPSAYMHELQGLSYNDSLFLFSRIAFAEREEDRGALEEIGREIVKKCKGVPLSLKVIGGVMHSKKKAQDWNHILKSQTWEIPDIANGILPALLLSYYNLPLHLKPCFAYCSIFRKDHEMKKDTLVQLWLAQGFIKRQGGREMETIGGEYFDDLLRRSLLQEAFVNSKGVTMHDLLHDLVQFITKNECCIFENGKTATSSVRHSSFIATSATSHIPVPLCHAKKLRTLIQMGFPSISTIPDNLFKCARSLRALDFRSPFAGIGIKELPSSIGLLKHLRYLDLSYSMIVELPESVSSLRNLQTLKLNGCQYLERLPSGMSAMVRLRHLEIEETRKLKYLPEGLGKISSLRTLSRFIVGGDGGCNIGELKLLDSLQGKLEIDHLERVGSVDEAKEAQLENKSQLRLLYLIMSPDDALELSGNGEVERMENVVEALQPPLADLEELQIWGYIGCKFPTWIGDYSSFSNLVNLKLIDCNKCTQLPGLGGLPSLKYLLIKARLVKRVGSEFYGNSNGGDINGVAFPKLEQLMFSNMHELEEWESSSLEDAWTMVPDEFEWLFELESRLENRKIMPCLRTLEVYNCPKLKALPQHLPETLKFLTIRECSEISWMNLFPPLSEYFQVSNSGGILSMPLPNLQYFQVSNSSGILSMPLPNLQSLRTFMINNIGNMTLLPGGWEQLKSLQSLTISNCSKLRSLPDDLGQLNSLRSLAIFRCPELLSLPQGLQGLTRLEINDSRLLAERCRGEGWSNISYIPNITINYKRIK